VVGEADGPAEGEELGCCVIVGELDGPSVAVGFKDGNLDPDGIIEGCFEIVGVELGS